MTRCLIIVISEGKASCVLNYHPTHRICCLLYTDKFVELYSNNYIFVLDLKVFCLKESLIDLIGSDIIVFLVSQSHFCIIVIKIFNCGLRIDKVQLFGVFRYYYMPAIGFSAVIVSVYFGIIFLSVLLGDGNRCSLNIGIHCGKGCALRNDRCIFGIGFAVFNGDMTRCLIRFIFRGKAFGILVRIAIAINTVKFTDKFGRIYCESNGISVIGNIFECIKPYGNLLVGYVISPYKTPYNKGIMKVAINTAKNGIFWISDIQFCCVFRYYYMPVIGFSAVYGIIIAYLSVLLGDGNRCSLNIGIHCGEGCALRNDSGVSALYLCAKGLVAKVYGNKSVVSGFVYVSECGCFFVYPNKLVIGSGGRIAANLEFNGKNQVFSQNSVFSASHSRNNAAGIGFRVRSVRFFGISDHAVIISGKLNIGYFEYFLLKIDVQFIAGNRVAKLRNSKFSRKFIAGFNCCANACNGKCNGRIRKGGNCDNAQNHYRRQQKGQ